MLTLPVSMVGGMVYPGRHGGVQGGMVGWYIPWYMPPIPPYIPGFIGLCAAPSLSSGVIFKSAESPFGPWTLGPWTSLFVVVQQGPAVVRCLSAPFNINLINVAQPRAQRL